MQPYDANQPNDGRSVGGPIAGKGKQGPNQVPTILNNAPTPAGLFRCLQRRLVVAVVVGLVFGGLAAGAAWMFAPEAKHTIRTTVRVPAGKHFAGVRTSDGPTDLISHQRNQAALVKNRLVLASALKDPNVAKRPLIQRMDPTEAIEWLEAQVQVDFSIAPEVLKISVRGLETDDLMVVVDAVREAYLREIVDKERLRQLEMQKALTKMIGEYEDKLKAARAAQKGLEAMLSSKDANALPYLVAFQSQMLHASQNELLRTKSALNSARFNLGAYKDGTGTAEGKEKKPAPVGPIDRLVLAEKVKSHPEVAFLKVKIDHLESKKTEIERVAVKGKKEKSYIQADEEVKQAREQLAKITKTVTEKVTEELTEAAKVAAVHTKATLEQELIRLEALEANLQREVDLHTKKLLDLTQNGAKAERDREDNGVIEKMLAHLRTEKENLDVVLRAKSPVDTLEKATVTRVDATQRRATITAGAGLGMFAFCLLGLAWLEYRTRKVASVDDVVLGLGMRLVGTVPSSRRAKSAPPADKGSKKVPSVSQQVLTESIDAARTTLLHLARSHSLRTVMVTSAVASEGKTSLSCHLAASLSRAGLRVLLIDADMRNPSAHKLFGLKCEVGFSEVLCGKALPEDCIQETSLRNLALLPAGFWTDNTAAALNQGRAAALFEQFRQQYDLIIVDSSPVLPVADSLLVAQQVDGVILSVLCNVSRLNNLYAAWQRVMEHGGQPFGVVINGVSGGTYGASYYYPYPRRPKVKA